MNGFRKRKMHKDPRVYLVHILESILLVEEYLHNKDQEAFLKSPALQDQIIRRIEIIGEAVRHVPAAIRASHPDIPWRRVAGMRDVLIHEYFNVDMRVAWMVATVHLPKLRRQIKKILEEIENPKS